jgi:autotransporter passenger strand-loop-strand repeat protein/autotransporter-associated beta strand protein
VLSSGGRQTVLAGGNAERTTVLGGGAEVISSGATADAATISSGGLQDVVAGGFAFATTILSGGQDSVSGVTFGETVSSGGGETIGACAAAIGLTVRSGGVLVDAGEVRFAGAGTLDGTLSGSGAIVQLGAGDLVLGGSGAAFGGRAVIEAGTIELATAGAIGGVYVRFIAPATGSAVLQIDAADAPAAGGIFANTIEGFNSANEAIDLRGLAFVAGASATVSGAVLTLSDGGETYRFRLAGAAGAYSVTADGHGGTLIDAKASLFTQAAAAFTPPAAAKALASSAAPTAQPLLLHATAPAAAGHT